MRLSDGSLGDFNPEGHVENEGPPHDKDPTGTWLEVTKVLPDKKNLLRSILAPRPENMTESE